MAFDFYLQQKKKVLEQFVCAFKNTKCELVSKQYNNTNCFWCCAASTRIPVRTQAKTAWFQNYQFLTVTTKQMQLQTKTMMTFPLLTPPRSPGMFRQEAHVNWFGNASTTNKIGKQGDSDTWFLVYYTMVVRMQCTTIYFPYLC